MSSSDFKRTRLEEKIEKIGFINGIYTPWFNGDYGNDIGYSITDGYNNCAFDEECVKETIFNCKSIGFDMTKIWLNENLEGMLFSESGSVIGVEPIFYQNLDKICQIASQCNLDVGFCVVAHAECVANKHLYDKCMRYVQIPDETEKYIKNWLVPILELTKKYPNILLIDIYAEPEADAGVWKNVSRGTNWSVMERFINRINRAVKDFDSTLATTVSSGTACTSIKNGLYNRINVDYIGADIYSNNADFYSPDDMLLECPFMLGEYGCGEIKIEDDAQLNAVKLMVERCIETMVKGAFYWNYGWRNNEDAGEAQLLYSNGKFRPVAAYLHYVQNDRNNELKVSAKDAPSLFYIRENAEEIGWFEVRGAKEYKLYKKEKEEWKEILSLKSINSNKDYPEAIYCETKVSKGETYMVSAILPNGESIQSKAVSVGKVVRFDA